MKPTCHACGLNMWTLTGPLGDVTICPRCDTSAQTGNMRVGPPNSPTTSNGWFLAPFGDKK